MATAGRAEAPPVGGRAPARSRPWPTTPLNALAHHMHQQWARRLAGALHGVAMHSGSRIPRYADITIDAAATVCT